MLLLLFVYDAFLRRRHVSNPKTVRLGPSNFVLLNLYNRAHLAHAIETSKIVQLPGQVAAAERTLSCWITYPSWLDNPTPADFAFVIPASTCWLGD